MNKNKTTQLRVLLGLVMIGSLQNVYADSLYCGSVACNLDISYATMSFNGLSSPFGLSADGDQSISFAYSPTPAIIATSKADTIAEFEASSNVTFADHPTKSNNLDAELIYDVVVASTRQLTQDVYVPITIYGYYNYSYSRYPAPQTSVGVASGSVNFLDKSTGINNNIMQQTLFANYQSVSSTIVNDVLVPVYNILPTYSSGDVAFSKTISVKAGAISSLSLSISLLSEASPFGANYGFGPGSMNQSLVLDPLITIDPSFADASLYSVLVSQGVGNIVSVPEPSNLALLSLGLLTLFARRRIS